MGLSTLFGRNASTRERPPSGLKHVRHTGRAHRLSFGKQLRTFMCFTTEEKLSEGGGSGDKRRRARGPLSQRLRLTESAEDQSSPSGPLEALSGLVLRPSTCPPDPMAGGVTEAVLESPPAHSELSGSVVRGGPSSFTLSSLNEEQLNMYLKVMLNQCITEKESRAATQKTSQDVAMASSGEQLESAAPFSAPVTAPEDVDPAASKATVGDKRGRRPTLRECEELIRRHEEMFGPIVTSRPAPLSHWLPQPVTSLPEPCRPPEPDTTYLSIPQDDEEAAVASEPEWDAWRQHFSSGPDGVWRIVTHDSSAHESEDMEEAGTAPSADARPRRLFGALRDKCSALFRPEQKTHVPDSAAVGDTLVESDTTGAKCEECVEDFAEKILSETKADDVLNDMNEEEVVPCTTSQNLCPVPQQPRHDPEVYRGSEFRHWRRFFRWSGAGQTTSDASPLDESWVTITEASEIPSSCVGLPASLWWGVSPLLEAVLRAADAGRLAVLLAQLRPASRRLRHSGLARLVERLDADAGRPGQRPPTTTDRQTLWLSRPELPQLFTAAGLGPADMTRWVLRVPHEHEDDAVSLHATAAASAETAEPGRQDAAHERGEQLAMNAVKGNTPFESSDHDLTAHTTPRAKFFEELMGTHVSDAIIELPAYQRDETASDYQADTVESTIIKQTDTSCITTPHTQFSSGWDAVSKDDTRTADDQRQSLEGFSASLILSANMAMPLCSDVCTFLLPEHQDRSRAESTASSEAAMDAKQAYETYGTEQWNQLGARRSKAGRRDRQPKPAAAAAASDPDKASDADPVGRFDSETELGAYLAARLSESGSAAALSDCHLSQLRNSSVRPIDSEVDIAQVLHEQSGYSTLGETEAPVSGGYQTLPLHEVDSETELGLALPLTDPERPLSAAVHRQVTAYDSETEMAALVTSLHGADSETEMGERLRRLDCRPTAAHGRYDEVYPAVGGEACRNFNPQLEPVREQRTAASDNVTRLPAAPVPVDSETEMGVVLQLFEQGMLSSRYFAGVPLPDEELDLSDPDVNICPPESQSERGVHFSGRSFAAKGRGFGTCASDQASESAESKTSDCGAILSLPIDDIYNASKEVSRKVIDKALFLLGNDPLSPPLPRTGSSPFGPSSGLDGIELVREAGADGGEPLCAVEGVCDPSRVIPEVSLTTSDGSFVVLFPPRPADTSTADYYETDEGLVLRLEKKQHQQVAESRGFQQTEAGLSLSERELSSTRRLLADRCAAAALRRRSPSPRSRASSDDGGLRVLYCTEGVEPWQPVSPEGLSGLSLVPTDPELAAVRWRKSSRGEDGDPEAWSSREAPSPPAESQSQTELRKEKAAPPSAVGANSWC